MGSPRFGFGIARSSSFAAARFVELCAEATRTAGVELVAVDLPSYAEVVRAVTTGRVALAWLPPLAAAQLAEQHAVDVIALPLRKGGLAYHTAFIGRRGGPQRIEDFRGSRVAWVDPQSASGYLMPRIHLASLGLDPRDFFDHETFAGTHFAVVEAVAKGAADLGATYCNIDPQTQRVVASAWTAVDTPQTRAPVDVVTSAGPIPNDAMVATSELVGVERARVMRFLLDPTERARGLLQDVFNTGDFRVAHPEHFGPLRHMLRAALARGHSMPPPAM